MSAKQIPGDLKTKSQGISSLFDRISHGRSFAASLKEYINRERPCFTIFSSAPQMCNFRNVVKHCLEWVIYLILNQN